MKTANQQFCAVESERSGDPLAGTAAHSAHNLLISWPRRKWTRSLRIAKDMGDRVSQAVDSLAVSGRRVNLIDRPGQSALKHQIFLFPEATRFEVDRQDLPAFLEQLELGNSLARWQCSGRSPSLILCCTHGRKDKCCAKFGYSTYKNLAATVSERQLPFEVWESSHLGGCRFAASIMMFPAMRKYGRLRDDQVLPFLNSESVNTPYLPCYRGSSLLTQAQQCAEISALEWLASRDTQAELVVAPETPLEDDQIDVQVSWCSSELSGTLRIRCGTVSVSRLDTCKDLDEGPKTASCMVTKSIRPL